MCDACRREFGRLPLATRPLDPLERQEVILALRQLRLDLDAPAEYGGYASQLGRLLHAADELLQGMQAEQRAARDARSILVLRG